ncbi:MAG: aldo/keto reductase [Oscillospiraceae bacterium]|jgi:aryl-alcohol dehydrogenase-like predicted oxidoreductase|nr:aldo/keto reductase [Oscillospiraceae bacterium]
MELKMQLCLGTAQFGMNYGIRGQKKPDLSECIEILDFATASGITIIDTAASYGNAEEIIGEFLSKRTIARNKIRIGSKVTPNILDDINPEKYYDILKKQLELSLKKLKTDYLDYFIFHSARYVFNPLMLEALGKLKTDGLVLKTGVSVYEVNEAEYGYKNHLDFMQMPFSIFDQRMARCGILEDTFQTEIHTRSAFIQGLITMNEDAIPPYLSKAKPIIRKLDNICREYGISRVEIALQYVKKFNNIDALTFGVDNIEQLKENIDYFNKDSDNKLIAHIENEFSDIEAEIVMPSLWHKQ